MHLDKLPTPSRRTYLAATAGLTATGLAGCLGTSNNATGYLSTSVTDQPGDIGDFQECVVTIAGVWIGPEGDDSEEGNETDGETNETDDEDSGRTYYEFEAPQEADLVQLQGDETSLIDEDREVSVGEYPYLQLDVTGVEGTLDGGEEATVRTPGNAPLQFKQAFEIRENTRTQFTADFTPVRTGPPGSTEYLIQPVPSGIEVTYEPIEEQPTNNSSTDT